MTNTQYAWECCIDDLRKADGYIEAITSLDQWQLYTKDGSALHNQPASNLIFMRKSNGNRSK